MKIDPPAQELLVRLLAAAECPWAPIRHDWERAQAICARRRGEVALNVGGGREAQRQAYTRQRDVLAEAGLLSGKRLTQRGKGLARAWSWPFERSELKKALKRLRGAIDRGDVLDIKREEIVPETLISGEYWGKQCATLQALFVPLLCDAVLFSRSDPIGRIYYGVSDRAGRNGNTRTETIDAHGEFSEELADVYTREYKRCRDEMRGDSRTYAELGELPVPLTLLVSGRDANETSGIRPLFPYVEAAPDG